MISSAITVCLVACLGVAAASICCAPPQWTARTAFITTVVHNGKATISRGMASMAYDAVNKKLGHLEQIEINGMPGMTVAVLQDFNTNSRYTLSNGKCIKTVLGFKPDDILGCIPDNSTLVGNKNVYGFGTNDAELNTYSIDVSGTKIYMTMTADACVPVAETVRGTVEGNYFMQNTQYLNISAGVAGADLRSPPLGCENAMTMPAHYTEGGFNTIGKRSFLFH